MEFRVINNKKYKVGDITKIDSGECYLVAGKYRREEAGYIAYNWTKKQYVMKSDENLIQGFVLDDKGEVRVGFFTSDNGTPLMDKNGNLYMNLEVAKIKGLSIAIGTTSNILTDKVSLASRGNQKENYVGVNSEVYSAKDSADFATKCKAPILFNDNSEFSLLLNPFTYGVELETSSGNLPKMFLDRYLLVPLKDGSITGHEYVTIPHKASSIIPYTVNACEALYDNCLVDNECSLHLHIGMAPPPHVLLVPFYVLMFRLQNEIHELFAPFKKSIEFLARKRGGAKDHCKYLPPLGWGFCKESEIYNNIIKWVTHGEVDAASFDDGKTYSKLNDQKWNIDSRYYIVQFVNYLFGKSPTIEFRLHSGTLDKHKAVFWIYICAGLIKYAMSHKKELMDTNVKIMLATVIREIYGKASPELCIVLLDYIDKRKKLHIEHVIKGNIYEDLNQLYTLKENFPMFSSDYVKNFRNGEIRENKGTPIRKGGLQFAEPDDEGFDQHLQQLRNQRPVVINARVRPGQV
jgi:hypothetical protein